MNAHLKPVYAAIAKGTPDQLRRGHQWLALLQPHIDNASFVRAKSSLHIWSVLANVRQALRQKNVATAKQKLNSVGRFMTHANKLYNSAGLRRTYTELTQKMQEYELLNKLTSTNARLKRVLAVPYVSNAVGRKHLNNVKTLYASIPNTAVTITPALQNMLNAIHMKTMQIRLKMLRQSSS